jgi:Tfp pilus assembly PilM family ATPase
MKPLLRRTSGFLSGLAGRRYGPIGLHMAREAIHLVQLDSHAGRVVAVRGWASVPLPPGDAGWESPKRLALLLRKAFVSAGFKGKRVVSAMPHGKVRIHSVTYRPTRERSATDEILHLMQERLEGGLANHVLDFLPVREGASDGERLALVTVSRREDVIAHLELLRRAGLDVAALEVGPTAIRRLVCALSPAGEPENVLVLNAGDTASFMTMISGRRLLFDQEVDFGERKLVELVAKSLDMPEQIVRDVVAKGGLDEASSRGLQDVNLASAIVEILRPEGSCTRLRKRAAAAPSACFSRAASHAGPAPTANSPRSHACPSRTFPTRLPYWLPRRAASYRRTRFQRLQSRQASPCEASQQRTTTPSSPRGPCDRGSRARDRPHSVGLSPRA